LMPSRHPGEFDLDVTAPPPPMPVMPPAAPVAPHAHR
jgi:hypothetical protein